MLQLIEFLAVVSGAIYRALLARRKQMDFVGVFSVALITAFGGGTLCDILLGRQPLFWITNAHYPVIVFFLALFILVTGHWIGRAERWLNIPDALGLGLFSIVGAGFALESNTSLFIASLFGVITGTFGGVIGDIVCNEVPNLFRCQHATLCHLRVCRMLGVPVAGQNWRAREHHAMDRYHRRRRDTHDRPSLEHPASRAT